MAIAEVDGESFERELEPYLEDNEFLRPEKAKDKKRNSKESNKRDKGLKQRNDGTVKAPSKSRESKGKSKGKTERGKAWRQGTLRINQEEFSDDDDDDFQMKTITYNAGLSENDKEKAEAIETLAREVPSKSTVRKEEIFPATDHHQEEDDCCYTVKDIKDKSLSEIEDTELHTEPDVIPFAEKPVIDINAVSSKLKRFQRQNSTEGEQMPPNNQKITGSPISDENDDICTQNISAYLPSSTPNRIFVTPRMRSSKWKFRMRITEAAVPVPPTFSDLSCLSLGDFTEDDNEELGKINDEGKTDRYEMAANNKENDVATALSKHDMDDIVPDPPALSNLSLSLDDIADNSPPIVEDVDDFRSRKNALEHDNVDSEMNGRHATAAQASLERHSNETTVSVADARKCEGTLKETSTCSDDAIGRLTESSESSELRRCIPNSNSRCFGKPSLPENENQSNDCTIKDSYFAENPASFKSADISNMDLFGDSLMINDDDDLRDFEDCPSPPVVAQTQVYNADRKQNTSGGLGTIKSSSNHLDRVKMSSPYHEVRDVKQVDKWKEFKTQSVSSAERDQMKMSPEKYITEMVSNCEEKRTLDTDNKLCLDAPYFDGEESIDFPGDFNMLSETEEDSQPPMLSLASRLRNRGVEGVDEVAEKTRKNERTEKVLGVDSDFKHPGSKSNAKQFLQTDEAETPRRLPLSRNKTGSSLKPSVRVPPWPRSAVCNSDDESLMPSLASHLKDRKTASGSCVVKERDDVGCKSTVSERFGDEDKKTLMPGETVLNGKHITLVNKTTEARQKSPAEGKGLLDLSKTSRTPKSSKHVTFSSSTDIKQQNDICHSKSVKANNVDFISPLRNAAANKVNVISPLDNTAASNAQFLSPGESPIIANRRRKRKPVGILSDDSRSSSCENDVVNKDSDEDSEDLALQRKKTSKIRLLATPTIRRGNESSDDDFDCGTSCKSLFNELIEKIG